MFCVNVMLKVFRQNWLVINQAVLQRFRQLNCILRKQSACSKRTQSYKTFERLLFESRDGETKRLGQLVDDNLVAAKELLAALDWSNKLEDKKCLVHLSTAHLGVVD